MRTFLPALLLAAAMTSACDGAPTLPDVSGNDGALRFDYSGEVEGGFLAVGNGVVTQGFGTGTWAVATRAHGWIEVDARQDIGDGRQNEIRLAIPVPAGAPSTVTIDWSRCLPDAACPGGVSWLVSGSGALASFHEFALSKGAIRITGMGGGRIRGTFSGSGQGFNGDGALQYRHGSFDVPLVALD